MKVAAAKYLMFALLLALPAACDDTGPVADNPVVVIHAAPGHAVVDVRVDGRTVRSSLPAGEAVRDSVVPGDHEVTLDGGGVTLSTTDDVPDGTALGVVLMGETATTIQSYRNDVLGSGGVRFAVINAVPGSALSITLDGTRTRAGLDGLPYTGSDQFSLNAGPYDVTVHDGDPGSAVDLGTLQLDRGRVFVVVYPDPDGPNPWTVGVF